MKCPHCDGETDVKDSRRSETNTVRRRRVCRECRCSFWTTEPPPGVAAPTPDRPTPGEVKTKFREIKSLMLQLHSAMHQLEQMAKNL